MILRFVFATAIIIERNAAMDVRWLDARVETQPFMQERERAAKEAAGCVATTR
jgi:hypothetical protein